MRILFFTHSLGRTRHFRGVVNGLAARGHRVILATTGRDDAQKAGKGPYAHPGIDIVTCPDARSDRWAAAADTVRAVRDRARYFDPRYAAAAKLAGRAAAHTPKAWNRAFERHAWLRRHWKTTQRVLAAAERLIPCDPGFLRFLRDQAPDVVLVTPLVDFETYQADYVKCAVALGIPVVYPPFSWDNLTNRGVIRVLPDRVLVWNRHQRAEAIDLHGVPPERIVITGAPRFDAFFSMRPSTTREEFCAAAGLDPDRPVVLYMCSSSFIAPYEVAFVREWIAALRGAAAGSWPRDCNVLIRPHPANHEQWETADLSDLPGVAVWTQKLTLQADQRLYDSLFHAEAAVGLNTSAMIEAAIVGRPVFTIRTSEFAGGQAGTLHFHYLLAENGGVVTVADSLDEHRRQLETAPAAADIAERSRRFLGDFVRPRGLDLEAAPIMVEEIERAAALRRR
ncbi:MAG: hypothetical protein AB7P99_01430 [Vicinamibacterales bacterium]